MKSYEFAVCFPRLWHLYRTFVLKKINVRFQDADATLESTKQNVTGALSSWGGWASSLAKSVTDKIDDQLTNMVEPENSKPTEGDGDLGMFLTEYRENSE